ncbi:MAG: fluoride efflux transporter CrcB [Flavobacterium sp.]|uniref:fluoride efflux transporter CrcB n=1 Tax=Flavobacterium sp. TaxID=239 RepID=UPI00121930B9|nr:fluoride efflux transporter CrcB [Flavobacterium sp.]RZJ67440.1 MAG: fluoride efflux transporter CrcB [Flavobacterium sp.]
MWRNLLLVAFGGAAGSVLRYLASVLTAKYISSAFPIATFAVNVLGCFLVGFFFGYLEKNQLSDSGMKWLLITGFCGGFTTFSAFSLENIKLFQNGNPALALIYIGSSIITGLAAVWLGLVISDLQQSA